VINPLAGLGQPTASASYPFVVRADRRGGMHRAFGLISAHLLEAAVVLLTCRRAQLVEGGADSVRVADRRQLVGGVADEFVESGELLPEGGPDEPGEAAQLLAALAGLVDRLL
jgi:hypothetical protein